MSFDAISAGIIWSRLIALVDEAAATLIRASFSTIVRESKDLAVVLTDTRGQMIAQSQISAPNFIGTIPMAIKAMIEKYAGEWAPGDIVITNDPWLGSGHLPDVTLISPVFRARNLIGFVGNTAHMVDIGGTGFGAPARSVYEEGLFLPPLKLVDDGHENSAIWEILAQNVRTPEQVLGDIRAQVSCNRLVLEALDRILDDYELGGLDEIAAVIHQRSQRALEAALEPIPNGAYDWEIAGDGIDEPFYIRGTVTVGDRSVSIDYSASSDQLPYPINAVAGYTYAYSAFPIKAAFKSDIPNNEGFFRPITVTCRPGTLVSAVRPAPVQGRHVLGQMLQAVVFGALAQCAPHAVQADSGTPPILGVFRGTHDGRDFAVLQFVNGGLGARATKDGISALSFPTNVSGVPVEVMENLVPVVYEEKSLMAGSGGDGTYRGGCGQRHVMRATGPAGLTLSLIMDKRRFAAKGLCGGSCGRPAAAYRLLESGARGADLNPKGLNEFEPGEAFVFESAGGGGYGPVLR